MNTSVVVSVDSQNGIGVKNGLLFRISQDLKHFKKLTLGHPIIMGRKTFESIGQVLPGRQHIIVTRDPAYTTDYFNSDCHLATSIEQAISLAKTLDDHQVFIIGGGEIFSQAMKADLIDKIYLTKVVGDFHADTFFPDYSHFKIIDQSDPQTEGEYQFQFITLQKS